MFIKSPTHAADCALLLNGSAQALSGVVFDRRNTHPCLLPDRQMPSEDIVGIVNDIVKLAVKRASTGSLAYVQTFYVQFARNCHEPEVPPHFENAFIAAMLLQDVALPRASVTLEFSPSEGVYFLQLKLQGLVTSF